MNLVDRAKNILKRAVYAHTPVVLCAIVLTVVVSVIGSIVGLEGGELRSAAM
jgi:ABC-type microcin C transport system permease subunit YejE